MKPTKSNFFKSLIPFLVSDKSRHMYETAYKTLYGLKGILINSDIYINFKMSREQRNGCIKFAP